MTQQVLQQRELLGREREIGISACDLLRSGIEAEVTNGQHHGPGWAPAPHDRADAREQLLEGDRLCEVVVGTDVEQRHTIGDVVPSGDNDDGRPAIAVAQRSAHLDSVHVAEPEVEQDRVVLVLGGEPDRLRPAGRPVDGVPLLLEAARDQGGQLRLVLDHQHSHGTRPSRRARGHDVSSVWWLPNGVPRTSSGGGEALPHAALIGAGQQRAPDRRHPCSSHRMP